MKRAMKQSTLTSLMNILTITSMLAVSGLFVLFASIVAEEEEIFENRYRLFQASLQYVNSTSYLNRQVRAYAVTGDEKYYHNYLDEVQTHRSKEKALALLEGVPLTAEQQAIVDQMVQGASRLEAIELDAMRRLEEGEENQTVMEVLYSDQYVLEINGIGDLHTSFLTLTEESVKYQLQAISAKKSDVTQGMVAILLLACIVQVLSALLVRKRLVRPLIAVRDEMDRIAHGYFSSEFAQMPDTSEVGMLVQSIIRTKLGLQEMVSDISQKLTAMADGDMTVNIDIAYEGEFQPIREAMERILESLNEMFTEIDQAAVQIAQSADQVTSGAQALSQGSGEQAGAVAQFNRSIKTISNKMYESAQVATETSDKANVAQSELLQSNGKMQEMIQAMGEINQSSTEIERIVKTIDEIAFQTNILSLNAAVEAARSGTAGKGFAVVADEVRNLANKCAQAVQDARKLIEINIHVVEKGAVIAHDTAASLQKVMDIAAMVVETMRTVCSSANLNSEMVNQINEGMDQISQVVQANFATAQQSAATSQQLLARSVDMKNVVSRFRLRRGRVSEAASTPMPEPLYFPLMKEKQSQARKGYPFSPSKY